MQTAKDNTTLNDLLPTTPDGQAERLAALKQLFPDLFTNEGRLNPDELKQLVEPNAVHESERYEFKWYGKAASKREAFTPTTATLVYDPARSVHPDQADGNMIIEGENLETLKLLLNAYREQVKCIYIDPPYNTGKDFIYRDNYKKDKANYWEETGVAENGIQLDSNPDTSGRYHSAWLCFMHERLLVARQLLQRDGVIMISIDDHELVNLRRIADEVFGQENHVANLIWEKGRKNDAKLVSVGHEYILIYAKEKAWLKEKKIIWREEKPGAAEIWEEYLKLKEEYGDDLQQIENRLGAWFADLPKSHPSKKLQRYRRVDKNGPWRDRDISWPGGGGPDYDVIHPETKKPCAVPERGWIYSSPAEMQKKIDLDLVVFRDDHTEPPFRKAHIKPIPEESEFDDEDQQETDDETSSDEGELAQQVRGTYFYKQSQPSVKLLRKIFGGKKVFPNPKDSEELAKLIHYVVGADQNALIVDFFGGSGSLAQAVLDENHSNKTNHRFITVQIPEAVNEKKKDGKAALSLGLKTVSSITIERVKRVIEGYGDEPQPIPDSGFKVYKLQKSNFPRCEFKPDPEASEADNVAALRQYIDDKEGAFFLTLNEQGEQAVFDEVCLKNGFQLHYTRTLREDFTENTIYEVRDPRRSALVCLTWNENIHDATIKRLRELAETEDKPFFICLERALTTTTKWNLKHFLGNHFNAF
ncbi:MAG TPA: site-specific DNA-methyltransferase [Opitutae bacterium]|nr:site-specific DNA-methyltransferase [Puniceicoccaceae bacterium]HBR93227.1 site-specific DNA-methyltransferase [Opitutae bacterium]